MPGLFIGQLSPGLDGHGFGGTVGTVPSFSFSNDAGKHGFYTNLVEVKFKKKALMVNSRGCAQPPSAILPARRHARPDCKNLKQGEEAAKIL